MTTITQSTRKAFTLLEMVAVLVLILVLAGIAVPTYQAVIGETRENAAVLSAKALRNYGDSYAATQQVAPSTFDGAFFSMACDELPGCGDGTTIVTLMNFTTLTLDAGTPNEVCATILWSNEVGGTSEVAPCVTAANWENATVSGNLTVNGSAQAGVQATLLKFGVGVPGTGFAPVCQNGDIDPTPSGFFYCTDSGQGGVVSAFTDGAGGYSLTVGANQRDGVYAVAGTRFSPFVQGYSNTSVLVLTGGSYTVNFNIGS